MSKGKEFPEELTLLEEASYYCENVIHDITKAQKYSDDLDGALDAIKEVAKVRFKELGARYDDMERSYINQKEAWEEMNPLKLEEAEKNMEKDLFGHPVIERTWQEEH